LRKPFIIFGTIAAAIIVALWFGAGRSEFFVVAQTEASTFPRVGERLTYNISFDKFPNVAYAETYVASRGKIGGKEAIEIQSKLKTLNFLTKNYFASDTARTTYVSPADGTPLYVKNVDNSIGAPIETVTNYADKGGSFDLTSILFKIRASGGAGSFTMFESDKTYNVSFHNIGAETVRSDAGEFLASIIEVKSEYLTDNGFSSLKISLAGEGNSIPVQIRLGIGKKSEFRGVIASIQNAAPEPTPTPTAVPTQTPRPTPRPTATPATYVNDQPLIGMPFALGENLVYTVTSGTRNIGTVTLAAKERKLIRDKDSLVLTATVTNTTGGELFRNGNGIRTNVGPETLSPDDLEMKFDGSLAAFSQSARFNQSRSVVTVGGQPVDVPVGTHNILSLVYAMRLYNLNLSKVNPIKDTRVAVFWDKKAHVFTLRPLAPQEITIGGHKLLAQQVNISTGNPQLDALSLKVWLSEDERRLPLRFSIGNYQLELVLASAGIQPSEN
jgi:hypothetical protein